MSELLTAGHFAAPISEDTVAEDWRRRGYSCHRFTDPPGQRWEDFVHDCNEVVTVVRGRLALEVAGQVLEAGPGDEVFIARGVRHSVRNAHAGTTEWLFGYD